MTVQANDFEDIREWRGSKDQAFEELCYQLRDQTPANARLVKTGNPDGGFEWYVTFRNGVQWGWQVKYIFDTNTLLTAMEKNLRTVVKKRPMCRKLTFCIPYDLPDSPGEGQWKSARQKFEDRKISWRRRIPGADRVRLELLCVGDLLQRLVQHPDRRGILRFFWDKEIFSPEWCAVRHAVVTDAVRGRYTPDLNINLPVAFSVQGLGLSEPYWQMFGTRSRDVLETAERVRTAKFTGMGVTSQVRTLIKSLKIWRSQVPDSFSPPDRRELGSLLDITRTCKDAAVAALPSRTQSQLQVKKRTLRAPDDVRFRLRYEISKLMNALDSFENLLKSSATEAAKQGVLILTGEAGQGKTHLFCDTSERAIEVEQPAVVILAGRLTGRQVWSEVAEQLGLGQVGAEELIGAMEAAGRASGAPFLLLIDALNESAEPTAWQAELPSLFAEFSERPWVSVGVSVRSSYRPIVLPTEVFTDVPEVEHQGFRGRELQAAERFFNAYGLEHPRIPLLTPEFTNPLFLKLYCEGLQDLGMSAPPVGEAHVTAVFERYLTAKAKRIVSRLKLDPALRPAESSIDAFTQALAGDNTDSLEYGKASEIINSFAPSLTQWPNTLYGQLLDEGVLTRDVVRYSGADPPVEVVRFTYQRFADYKVGATLLNPLNDDPQLLRRALAVGGSLTGRLTDAPAGWIEALSVLIPEHFELEFLDLAPQSLVDSSRGQWEQAFIRSITMRRGSAATPRTRELLDDIIQLSPELEELALETVLSVATDPQHLLNANALHDRLMKMTMSERDASWSKVTYFSFDHGGALDRLINWVANGPYDNCPDDLIELAATTITWTFTSPNRRMRDYTTKALSQLLAVSLSMLPRLIKRFRGVSDPYVVERLAAVSYGAIICGGSKEPRAAVLVAEEIKRVALSEEQIPNVLARDSVRGIYEWCVRNQLVEQQKLVEVLPPYGAEPPDIPRPMAVLKNIYGRRSTQDDDTGWPYGEVFDSIFGLVGDFGIYVIDSKLSYFTQYPLSSDQPLTSTALRYPQEEGRRWVFERVLSLGWTPEEFAYFDKFELTDYSGRSEHKAERFGKKYQWIALNELIARISDNFQMSPGFGGLPVMFSGPWQFLSRDIDPTLPPPRRVRDDKGGQQLRPTFASNADGWWMLPRPKYRREDPPVGDTWAVETDDIANLESIVRRRDPRRVRWVTLYAYFDWQDGIQTGEAVGPRRQRSVWSFVQSWLVRHTDQNELVEYLNQRKLWGRWMPEGRNHTDAAYLGELPWAAATDEYPDSWRPIGRSGGLASGDLYVYPTWASYFWEGNVLDCSINDGVVVHLPAPALFKAGELSWMPGSREWCGSDGTEAAQFCESEIYSALLVREDWLKRTLKKAGYSIVFGRFGEKQLLQTESDVDLVADWTRISDTASLTGTNWTFGEPRFERRPVPG